MKTKTVKIGSKLDLTTPEGEVLSVTDVALEILSNDSGISELRLHFGISRSDWDRVDQGAWFGLSPEVRGPCFAGGFNPEPGLEVEARLAPDPAQALLASTDHFFRLAAAILGAKPDEPLRQTESWIGLYVKQQRGAVKSGFATKFAD
jgi:hypothetical protein